MTHVRDDGPKNARLVLIGEAPGKHEMLLGRPFMGPSGHRLEVWWRKVGLTRADFFITNVLPYQPDSIDKVPRAELERWIEELHNRLAALEDPWLIIPTGNYALYALTGKGKVSWHRKDGRHERPGIMDWRGSLLSYDHWGRVVKVIPTIHPAHVLRTPSLERRAILDWQQIADERGFRELNLPERYHHIKPTLDEIKYFMARAFESGKPLSLDIETPKSRVTEYAVRVGTEEVTHTKTGKPLKKPRVRDIIEWKSGVKKIDAESVVRHKSGKKKGQPKSRVKRGDPYIGCIGFAFETNYSLTIPLTLDYWKTKARLEEAEAVVALLLHGPNEKVMQNGMFDSLWLRRNGYEVVNWKWDTRAMHHCLDPRDDHDLAYMASIYTRQPFWKHEAKDPNEIEKYASNSEALWTYNGIDCCVTLELFYALKEQLELEGMDLVYKRSYAAMLEPLLDMSLHGVQVDVERRDKEYNTLLERADQLGYQIEQIPGFPLIAVKGLSGDRLKYLFYGAKGFEGARAMATYEKLRVKYPHVEPMNLPPQRAKNTRGGRSITVNEVAIRKLTLKFPRKLDQLGPLLLEYRRNVKMRETLSKPLDYDGRLRCQYSFITDVFRLACQETPWGTGTNLQNQDRELRYIYIPDKE